MDISRLKNIQPVLDRFTEEKNAAGLNLLVYKDGLLVHRGDKHEFDYVQTEEKTKLLYLGFASL